MKVMYAFKEGLKTLPEAQRTQKLTPWHALVANLATNPAGRQSKTGCICLTFLQGVFFFFSNESSKCLYAGLHIHTGCIFGLFPLCVFQMRPQIFSKASSNRLPQRRLFHISCIYLASSTVCFQKSVKSVWIRCCICLTFSSVCVQMSPQIACLREGIFTQVAFILFLVTVCYQMFV